MADCIKTKFNDPRTPTHDKWRALMKDLVPATEWNNPAAITQAVAEHFVLIDLLPAQLDAATIEFKSSVPQNHFDAGIWSLTYDQNPPIAGTVDENKIIPQQFKDLMAYLLKTPENFMS